MRIQLIEHDPEDFSHTNISFGAAEKGYPVKQTYVCNNEDLPPIDSFDWLMVMGGSQHAWDEQGHPWLQKEKAFVCNGRPAVGLQFHPEYTREMVTDYARQLSQDWVAETFVSDKDKVLAQTKTIPDTYGLMETLLNNIEP